MAHHSNILPTHVQEPTSNHPRINIYGYIGDIGNIGFETMVKSVSYPANIVLTLCGDWLEDHFLAANAEENLFDLAQKFLARKKKIVDK